MNETLEKALQSSGWRSGTHRGFRATNRAGIDFEVGEARGEQGRLVLRYRYHTTSTNAEGEVALPANADLARIQDAMTEVYLRVHEKPDPTRVFGGGKRRAAPPPTSPAPTASPAAPEEPLPNQGALDL